MYNEQTFYVRCLACDKQLDMFQQKRGGWSQGLCTQCKDIVFATKDPWCFEESPEVREKDIYRMWNPPMGDIDEFFQDVDNTYNGGSSE